MSDSESLRVKREPRPTGRELPELDDNRLAMRLVRSSTLHAMAEALPHLDAPHSQGQTLRTRGPGRKPEFPHAAYLIALSLKSYRKSSGRRIEAFLQNPHEWGCIRDVLVGRHPQYPRLAPGEPGPSRTQFQNWQRMSVDDPTVLPTLLAEFRLRACAQARAMGMFDATRTDVTKPNIANMLIADGTWGRARYSAAPGDLQLNRATGEMEQIRHDPQARNQVHKADDDIEQAETVGHQIGIFHATTGVPGENVILDLFYVLGGKGYSEAIEAMEHLPGLLALLPGTEGLLYDKAMHGAEIDKAYDLGIQLHAKVAKAPGGKLKERQLENVKVRNRGAEVGTLPLFGVGGAGHVRVPTGKGYQYVRLIPLKRTKNPNKGAKGRPWRWYQTYRVPDDPLIPAKFRGGTIRTRLDTTASDRAHGINRAENLRPVAEDDDYWEVVGGPRSRAESMFSKLKHQWPNKRLAAVGTERVMLQILGFAIAQNEMARHCYEARTGLDITGSLSGSESAAA